MLHGVFLRRRHHVASARLQITDTQVLRLESLCPGHPNHARPHQIPGRRDPETAQPAAYMPRRKPDSSVARHTVSRQDVVVKCPHRKSNEIKHWHAIVTFKVRVNQRLVS